MTNELLLTSEAAAHLRVARQTLENWRVIGRGPVFCKIGGRIVYEKKSLDKFVSDARVTSTSEAKG
jgi:hypothetical protein